MFGALGAFGGKAGETIRLSATCKAARVSISPNWAGHLEVSLVDGRSYQIDVVAAEDIERKGLFGRAGDAILALIRGN